MRVGFTCSKKVGNAVIRNRAKRRLREVARAVVTRHGKAGFDYVFVGRNTVTEQADFDSLIQDATLALQKLHSIQRP
jgi:ribonuclease P protein component